MLRTFASDNNAPVAPEILAAIVAANEGDAIGYGDDPFTKRAIERFRQTFGAQTDVYFAFNGTGANVVALASLLKPYEAVLTPESSHVQTDECGALERFSGCKVIPVGGAGTLAGGDGKLRPGDLAAYAHEVREPHHVVPRVLSISQATEFGGVYTREELSVLCAFAHASGWLVHLDGARICNAAAALHCPLREITDCGVDVLTFGGTKNGLLLGEAICFFNPAQHGGSAPFVRKQGMQLASKSRYIAAQFEALLAGERWRAYASHANAMAKRLEERLKAIQGVRITRPVEANAVFATLDGAAIPAIAKEYFFYCFDEALPEVRWMTHHATREEDVDRFACVIASALGQAGRGPAPATVARSSNGAADFVHE